MSRRFLLPGKLPSDLLEDLLSSVERLNHGVRDREGEGFSYSRLVVGPRVGQDVSVLEFSDRYVVMKTDPITFATDRIGYYAVHVNVNDVVTSGAEPRWFSMTLLLPEGRSDEDLVRGIFSDVVRTCGSLGIGVAGGHTEVSVGLDRPVLVGFLLGEVSKERLVTTFGARPGDVVLITKGIVIEGTAIMASERSDYLLSHGVSLDMINRGRLFLDDPGISVYREARLLHEHFSVHAMHDPTEGGLSMGVVEVARNSGCGVILDRDRIPFVSPSLEFCDVFGLDPLRTITSGTLIAALSRSDGARAVSFLRSHGISASIIGEFTSDAGRYYIRSGGELRDLEYSEQDEITRIFSL